MLGFLALLGSGFNLRDFPRISIIHQVAMEWAVLPVLAIMRLLIICIRRSVLVRAVENRSSSHESSGSLPVQAILPAQPHHLADRGGESLLGLAQYILLILQIPDVATGRYPT